MCTLLLTNNIISYFYYNTSDVIKAKKVVKSGKITDPDRLFINLAKHIFERYTQVGIRLGLKGEVLTDELETGEFKMLIGSKKALKMLQLWQQSVTEDDCTYSMLAAALEKEGFKSCADKYCYTTGNHVNVHQYIILCTCPDV